MYYEGIIEKGSQRARALGYPTINIRFAGEESGVFAAKAQVEGRTYEGVAFADRLRGILEAHLFGLSEDFYGKRASIDLMKKLRERMDVPDEAAMRDVIAADAAAARTYFAH